MGDSPILHLSFPVSDLEEARSFYVGILGSCQCHTLQVEWCHVHESR